MKLVEFLFGCHKKPEKLCLHKIKIDECFGIKMVCCWYDEAFRPLKVPFAKLKTLAF